MGLWSILDGHQCCYKHCNQPATCVMVEAAWNRGRTFANGAGLCCLPHANESERDGCLTVWQEGR
jgi:hypothetical protein